MEYFNGKMISNTFSSLLSNAGVGLMGAIMAFIGIYSLSVSFRRNAEMAFKLKTIKGLPSSKEEIDNALNLLKDAIQGKMYYTS